MKTFIRTTIFALLALLSFSSCINDDDNITTQNEEIAINLIVSLGPSQKTRAYSRETVAIGNEYFINVDPTVQDFELLVYENKTLRTKAILTYVEKESYNTYKLSGKFYTFHEDDLGKTYKFVVIANAKDGSCKTTTAIDWLATGNETNLYSQLKYEYNASNFTQNVLSTAKGNTERIPMWGSVTTKLKNKATIGINLMRAMAKVTVCTASGLDKKIESVKLVGYNNAGMLTPAKAANNSETYEVNSSNGETELNVPTDASFVTTELPFATYEKNGTTYHCLYIPEQKAGKDSKILVTIDGKVYTLYFANYGSNNDSSKLGDPFPVLRNNWYNYVIKSVSPKGIDLSLNYYVADWNVKEATNIEFN